MEIKRTANAGVLLRLDGVTFLLDGVCNTVYPYLATPEWERRALLESPPQVVAFTHKHTDHYDGAFVSDYLKHAAGPILGPADIPFAINMPVTVDGVTVIPIPSRHLGKAADVQHVSYILQGSRCVWFLGDASPQPLLRRNDLPRPDVLIAPYVYATAGGWRATLQLAPKALVLLHLPLRTEDPHGLWPQVEQTVGQGSPIPVYIPEFGQRFRFSGD